MQSRRDVLRMGAGAAGAGVMASFAGCSNVPVVGSYFEDGIEYTEWAYDPEALGTNSVSTSLMHVADLLDKDDLPNKGDLRENVTENYSGVLMADDVEYLLSIGQSEVLIGSFDADDLVEEMEVSSTDGYGDFDVYTDEADEEGAEDALIATDGDYLVRSGPSRFYDYGVREQLELLIDTYNGDADRFVDTNDDFEQVIGEIESGDIVSATGVTESEAEEREDGQTVGNASVMNIDGEDVVGTIVWLFKHEDGVDLEEMESDLEDDETIELDDISQDGRMVTAEFTMPTDEMN